MIEAVTTRLDLTGSREVPREYAVQLDEIGEELRRPYAELIRELSAPFRANLDWWVTALASRNTYVCPLFSRLCTLVLAKRVAERGGIREVVVDTPALATVLRAILPRSVKITCSTTRSKWILLTARRLARRLAIAIYSCAARWFYSGLYGGRPPTPEFAVTVLDTVLYEGSIVDGEFRDRHYPGLLKHVTAEDKRSIYWMPSYYGIRNYAGIFRKVRKCTDHFLLPEDYLRLADYFFALAHVLRAPAVPEGSKLLGMDVTQVVHEAYAENRVNLGSIEGLLRYRAAMRMRDTGVKVKRVIEWFENQEGDHGSVAGWRKYFPQSPVLGYQGFINSKTYLSLFPIDMEKAMNFLPHTVAVMGPDLVAPAKEFCADLEVTTAPAFRYQAAWRPRFGMPEEGAFTVLVSLPIQPGECNAILNMVAEANRAIGGSIQQPFRLLLKPHPAWRKSDVDAAILHRPTIFQVVGGSFDDIIDRVDALVTSASTTCVQAIVRGIPVAIVARPGLLTQNPMPDSVDRSAYSVCYAHHELRDALVKFSRREAAERERLVSRGRMYRDGFFQPVSAKTVSRFLGLSDDGV